MDGFLEALAPKPMPTRTMRDPVIEAINAEARAAMADPVNCAIALLEARGYRITKPKPRAPRCAVPVLNAVGKPYGANYDPKYRVKHRTTTAHLFKPYGNHMQFVR